MQPRTHLLKNSRLLLIREAEVEDARLVLEYVEDISGESDFLSFGPGELGITESEEQDILRNYRDSENQLYLVGVIEGAIVSSLNFTAGRRPRVRHCGEFGMSVRRPFWDQGIGSFMIDALIAWARSTNIITKINLRVRTDNHRAMCVYQRKGFVHEGTVSREMLVNGVYHDHHYMGLQI